MRFEYKIVCQYIRGSSDEKGGNPHNDPVARANELNRLGEEGWELVSTFPLIMGSIMVHEIQFVFKRIIGE